MSALSLPLPRSTPVDGPAPGPDEPVALLQLDAADTAGSASAIYREVRRGRRVVAVAAGGAPAIDALARALDAIGVTSARPGRDDALLEAPVSIVAGPETAIASPLPPPTRPLRVALAGCGVVGGGVLARLLADPRFVVVGVLVRDPAKPRDIPVPGGLTLTDPGALLAREPDVLVEAVSDPSTGLALIRAALTRGVQVVSASKQALATELPGLHALAAAHGATLRYSASVGGGAPLIETARRAREHGPVVRIEAVLNGTCNFILNRLAVGASFDQALAQARAAGFAEEDPSADLTGLDAAAKLAILAHEAGVDCPPIDGIDRQTLGANTILPTGGARQLARLDIGERTAAIRFGSVGEDRLLTDLPDEWNALRVVTADGRVFTARGRGAGRRPTTESVWADISELLQP
jgi:homoserine dehydrogenase